MKPLINFALGGALLFTSLPMAAPVFAAQDDIDLLKSYVGEWRGRGVAMFAATGQDETVVCRMSVEDTGIARITFNGRCTLAGRTIAVAGTMIWNESAGQYEAAMSSVGSYQGVAIGRRNGDNVGFELTNRNAEGKEFQIEAALALESDQIGMDFQITEAATGAVTTARIPFAKQ